MNENQQKTQKKKKKTKQKKKQKKKKTFKKIHFISKFSDLDLETYFVPLGDVVFQEVVKLRSEFHRSGSSADHDKS